MKEKLFVPLHTHSEFSALDGASKLKDIIKKGSESGMPAMAVTDHGVMNSMVSFYKKARAANIKPIVGCEIYVSPKTRFDKVKLGDGEKNAHHLVLLAKNKTGAKNLNILCSSGHLEGFYYKPRIDNDLLRQHSEGLIALTACLGGVIPQYLLKDDYEGASRSAKLYKEIFKDDFYLELQDHGDPTQDRINRLMIKMSEDLNIPLVATNDSHFTHRSDKAVHDMILAISTGATRSDPNKLYYTDEHYFKTPEEMWDIEIFKHHPEALINTVRIAEKCNYIMELGINHLPDFPVPQGHSQASYLRELTYQGLERRYDVVTEEIKNRADYELSVIEKMGFPGYLLIVWDFIKWAKDKDIPVGCGRGSCAGSIICYATEITGIDPMRHNLLFERFLNPERVSMPDIDVDFCIERRSEVMNYVAKKYGDDRVCQIVTFGTMGAKQAFKDVARVIELPYSESDRLSKLIPKDVGITLREAMMFDDFKVAIENSETTKEIIDLAQKLEGNVRNYGTHAAGVIISKYPLNTVVPLMGVKEPKKKDSNDDELIVRLSSQTQVEQKDAEDLGLIKMDFLGLRNLTTIKKTMDLIKARHGIDINWDSKELTNMDDPKVYEYICRGDLMGLFQIETSEGMRKLVMRMKPSRFEDLSAILALYRPGPLGSGMHELYVKCKHGEIEPEYLHPDVKHVLEPTYGTLIYQEQIMQIAQVLSGYSLAEADLLRRAMGKKKPEEMAKQRSRFIEGCIEKKYTQQLAQDTFEKMAKFADYGFNLSHSAAYGAILYSTAWFKTHYPAEFMASLLTSLAGKNDKIIRGMRECEKLGILILPPDINESERAFSVTSDGNIRFGLLSIKGVGEDFIASIINERNKSKFTSLADFCKRVNHKTYNGGSLEKIIKCGCFDSLERNRAFLIDDIENILPTISKQQKASSAGQFSLFSELPSNNIKKKVEPFTSESELEFERELIGIYVSGHPLGNLPFNYEIFSTDFTKDLVESEDKNINVSMCVIIRNLKKMITKRGKNMAFMQLEDIHGVMPAVCFPDTFEKYSELLVENGIIYINGNLSKDKDDINQIIINDIKEAKNLKAIYLKIDPSGAEKLSILQKNIARFKGDTPLVFEINDDLIVAEKKYWLKYSNDLVQTAEKIFGKNTIYLK